ncbi:hypothetical protein Patl1_33755 [Pistacia atlantica]|uniref:Uncharacterized protein n=1 Tax=Pistacia atlantica TaxID=434234 RepID=A0ACC0ZW24_9ROSI|nr:hypothetical protein Patl1_33755 [Pistacia atlantica]
MDASLCWNWFLQDIGWLRSITSLPILIKGVFTPEDGKLQALSDYSIFSNFIA